MHYDIFKGFKKLGRIKIVLGKCTDADNDLRYMKGWIEASVIEYAGRCGWRVVKV